jgi:glycosyltransferase 2 family protein
VKRPLRITATVVLTAAATAYVLWKIDLGRTVDVFRSAHLGWVALALAIQGLTVPVLALRWKWLLRAHGVEEPLRWLTRAYFVAYTAGQVLPTSLGGDAVRVVETTRRNPGRATVLAGTVFLERGLGGAATVILGAVGFAVSVGRYDVGGYLWLEGAFVLGTIALAFVFFARSARPLLRIARPLLARFRLERLLRDFYESIHSYRSQTRLLVVVLAVTFAVQAVRVLAIWASARAVGIDLGARVYYVMGPLLFLVMLVPFTLNGIAVREAFFVSFLGTLDVSPDRAFAAGFLFFLVTAILALPGAFVMLWEGVRGSPRPRVEHG